MPLSLSDAALQYATLGYRVFPVTPRQKEPPLILAWQDNATSDPAQVAAWWKQHPQANIAICCHGLLLLDVDGPGNAWLSSLSEDDRLALLYAPNATTPRGGCHFLFAQPDDRHWRNTQGNISPFVDTRGYGGYFIAPPSARKEGSYAWSDPNLQLPPATDLPYPPTWLAALLDRAPAKSPAPASSTNAIAEGSRNGALTRLAGAMRRVGMGASEILGALTVTNSERCAPPLSNAEVARIAASVAKYEPDQVATALVEGEFETRRPINEDIVTVRDLVAKHPDMRPPVIHDLLRQGETMNCVSAPKVGKSWLSIDLALAVVTGSQWLGRFQCEQGDVLILDNELHPETAANRIPRVAAARGLCTDQYADHIGVRNFRGSLLDLFKLRTFFEKLPANRYKLIICDAFYRFLPRDTDENDNGTIANLYNLIDLYADSCGSSFVLIHHSSKGSQAGKGITDVGSGAGSQSRAADTHLVLRRHEEEGIMVLEAECRTWRQPEAITFEWQFPVWNPVEGYDPHALKSDKPAKKEPLLLTPQDFASRFVTAPTSREAIIAAAQLAGMRVTDAKTALIAAVADGTVIKDAPAPGKPAIYYAK